jgi:branched-chain amino acid transport system substrate-binding protein
MLLAAALAGCARPDGPIRLGTAGKWDSGYGAMSRKGIELAIEEINRTGIGNRRVELVARDDKASGMVAAAVADSFASDPTISAVIGHLSSGAMVAAAKVYDGGHLPAVATTATSPDLTGISPWVFRVVPSDSASAIELARFAQTLGKKQVAVLYENDAYGRGLAEAFRRAYKGEILLVDPIGADLKDFEPQIAWLKKANVELVFVAGTEATGLPFIAQAKKLGLTADLMGSDGWAPVVSEAAAEGAYVGVPFSALDPRRAAQTFVAAFRQKYGVVPDNNAALGYDATMLLASAIRAVGPDREKIRTYLASGATYEGSTGSIRLGPDGDPVGKGISMTRIHNATMQPVGAP